MPFLPGAKPQQLLGLVGTMGWFWSLPGSGLCSKLGKLPHTWLSCKTKLVSMGGECAGGHLP